MDAACGQFPHEHFEELPQDEQCLFLNVTAPSSSQSSSSLPVLVFLHGGAFFLGSASRPYYSPLNLLSHSLHTNRPFILVSVNYRLGALGFLHSPHASSLVPPNNGLHDQLRAFEWIHSHIGGFGGDSSRITALGQSAGSESLSLHTISSNPMPLFKQMICLSGSPVTMPCKTPPEHQTNFLTLAEKAGIKNIPNKTSTAIAEEIIKAPISTIRDLSFVGAPCSSSEVLPYDKPTMALARSKPVSSVPWLQRAIYSSATYDGGVSYNILHSSKKDNASTFIENVRSQMSDSGAEELLSLYEIKENDGDEDTLRKICQFESDIGFWAGSWAQVIGSNSKERYFQIFDLKNPFDKGGALPKEKFATHTWDIVSLLGAYDEMLDEKKLGVVKEWRDRILRFVVEEDAPWELWHDEDGKALRVADQGVSVEEKGSYLDENEGRRKRLLAIAEKEKGEEGWDFLWEGVCRQWLD